MTYEVKRVYAWSVLYGLIGLALGLIVGLTGVAAGGEASALMGVGGPLVGVVGGLLYGVFAGIVELELE